MDSLQPSDWFVKYFQHKTKVHEPFWTTFYPIFDILLGLDPNQILGGNLSLKIKEYCSKPVTPSKY